MKTKSWCFKGIEAKFIQGASLALNQNLDGGSEHLKAWFIGNGPRFHTSVHLATFYSAVSSCEAENWSQYKGLDHLGFPSCLAWSPSGQPFPVLLLPVFLSPPLNALYLLPLVQPPAESAFCHALAEKTGPLLLFPPHFRQIYLDAQVHGVAKSGTWLSNRARTRSTANAVFQFCSSNSKLRPILLPSLDFPSFTMLPFKLISWIILSARNNKKEYYSIRWFSPRLAV